MADQSYWINLLDMGPHTYGDSVFINHPQASILIDGGYGALAADRPQAPSIPSQLARILDREPPFEIDLLVVTHGHLDHVGCLPRLVEDGVLRPEWALVADPDLAFGPFDGVVAPDAPGLGLLALALREEPHDRLPDAELLDLLEDGLTLEQRYREMLERLADAGTRVVRYGRDPIGELEARFGPSGLSVLGPTVEHLETCARELARLLEDGLARADALALPDGRLAPTERLAAYRRIARGLAVDSGPLAADVAGRGAALNDQSIVLLFESAGAKALLPGDMQLAAAEVPGLDDSMAELLETLAGHAPFQFLKVAHHSSYNGLDERVLEALPAAVYGHTGGRGSASHPHRDVLKLLKHHAGELEWVRTDRNGQVGVRLGETPLRVFLAYGHRNDFRPPVPADAPAVAAEPAVPPRPAPPAAVAVPPAGEGAHVEVSAAAGDGHGIELVARIPNRAGRVVISVEIAPGAAPAGADARPPATSKRPSAGASPRLAGGREVPRLLFATSRRLGTAIGDDGEAARILELLRRAGHEVVDDLPSGPEDGPAAAADVRAFLDRFDDPAHVNGVVLLGGYDVVPAVALDVLGEALRKQVSHVDGDRFVVWSDDPYGDRDGDGIPEHAVSRVPHRPGSADLLWTCLAARGGPSTGARFGIRNVRRPFAEEIFALLPGSTPLLVSAPATRQGLPARRDEAVGEYFMLHGSAQDATRFWGEDDEEEVEIEAFHIDNVPASFSGVVLSGCCWGALPVAEPAGWRARGQPVRPRTPDDSIALRYLAAGAWAFVGCTGSHYSPGEPPYSYFGAPFHLTFWTFVTKGYPPALALLETKWRYAASIPHLPGSRTYTAVELKILQQFTCLGLGW